MRTNCGPFCVDQDNHIDNITDIDTYDNGNYITNNIADVVADHFRHQVRLPIEMLCLKCSCGTVSFAWAYCKNSELTGCATDCSTVTSSGTTSGTTTATTSQTTTPVVADLFCFPFGSQTLVATPTLEACEGHATQLSRMALACTDVIMSFNCTAVGSVYALKAVFVEFVGGRIDGSGSCGVTNVVLDTIMAGAEIWSPIDWPGTVSCSVQGLLLIQRECALRLPALNSALTMFQRDGVTGMSPTYQDLTVWLCVGHTRSCTSGIALFALYKKNHSG